jgi:hypothetical protein
MAITLAAIAKRDLLCQAGSRLPAWQRRVSIP